MKTPVALIISLFCAQAMAAYVPVANVNANAKIGNNTFVKGTPRLGVAMRTPVAPTYTVPQKPAVQQKVKVASIAPTDLKTLKNTQTFPVIVSDENPEQLAPIPATRPVETSNIDPSIIAPIPLTRPLRTASLGKPDSTPSEVTTPQAAPEENTVPFKINNLSNCKYTSGYGGDCWRKTVNGRKVLVPLQERIQRIVADVNYVNDLHGTYISPRYMLCTGAKESGFDIPEGRAFIPNITNGINARGMYQVIPSTARAAVRSGNPKVPGFTGLNGDQYTSKMLQSTTAQVELSLLVLEMKVREFGNKFFSDKILTRQATDRDYWDMAYLYYGTDNHGRQYANRVQNCYQCLERISDADLAAGKPYNGIKNCLMKTKVQ